MDFQLNNELVNEIALNDEQVIKTQDDTLAAFEMFLVGGGQGALSI